MVESVILDRGRIIQQTRIKNLNLGNRNKLWKVKLNKNTFLLSSLLGGAIGSYIYALTTGRNVVHNLYPIFERAVRAKELSYEEALELATAKEAETKLLAQNRKENGRHHPYNNSEVGKNDFENGKRQESVERLRRETNRLYRKVTMKRTLTAKQGGLSDSHGGHWLSDEQIAPRSEGSSPPPPLIDDDITQFRKG